MMRQEARAHELRRRLRRWRAGGARRLHRRRLGAWALEPAMFLGSVSELMRAKRSVGQHTGEDVECSVSCSGRDPAGALRRRRYAEQSANGHGSNNLSD